MAKDVDQKLIWFPIDCFMVRELMAENSPLHKFVKAYHKEETRQCQAALAQPEARKKTEKVDSLFVKVVDKDKNKVLMMEY